MTNEDKFLIAMFGGYSFGVPIALIQDVIQSKSTTSVPLAPDHVTGLLNLRGHIVTEIDVGGVLAIPGPDDDDGYSIVIQQGQEMYSLAFGGVGDVLDIPPAQVEPLPDTIDQSWQTISKGVYRMDGQLLVLLDLDALIAHVTDGPAAAAL